MLQLNPFLPLKLLERREALTQTQFVELTMLPEPLRDGKCGGFPLCKLFVPRCPLEPWTWGVVWH